METLVHLECTSSDLSCVYADVPGAPYFFSWIFCKLYSKQIALGSNDFSPKSTLYTAKQAQSGSGSPDSGSVCNAGRAVLTRFRRAARQNHADAVLEASPVARHWLPFLINGAAAKLDESGAWQLIRCLADA